LDSMNSHHRIHLRRLRSQVASEADAGEELDPTPEAFSPPTTTASLPLGNVIARGEEEQMQGSSVGRGTESHGGGENGAQEGGDNNEGEKDAMAQV
ncbi:hypothetical protein HDU93_007696, partial [Gonapodya sp. JEL0774]